MLGNIVAIEFFLRVIIVLFIILTLLTVRNIVKVRNEDSYRNFFIAFLTLLAQHILMVTIKFLEVFFKLRPLEPFFPIVDHILETIFFIFLLTGVLHLFLTSLKSQIINKILLVNLIALGIMSAIIFNSYVTFYEMGIRFGNHWGDIFFESWHIIILESLIFIFSFAFLVKKQRRSIMFLIVVLVWFLGHVGHLVNLAVSDNTFIFLKWLEWPLTTISIAMLYFIFRGIKLGYEA